MALIRLDHVPQTVGVNLPLNIIMPDPGQMRDTPVRARKVLYLLHGLSDDASAWQRYTTIETAAAMYGLVVIMPSVGRSFYTDQPNGQRYFTYLTEELPQYLSDVFGLEPRREDTLIAGVSMGGYGAFKAALRYPERFAAAASISGVLSLEILRTLPNDPRQAEFAHVFGSLDKLAGGEHDPLTWLKMHQQRQKICRACILPAGGRRICILLACTSRRHAAARAYLSITTKKTASMNGSSGISKSSASWQPS
jgi:putative tributyrin esterase